MVIRGAYLPFNDVHTARSDAVMYSGGLDVTAEVALEIDVREGVKAWRPRQENAELLTLAASTRPLFHAYRPG